MEPSSNLLSRYKSFEQTRLRPEDYVKRYSKELGVDSLRGRVSNARGAIRATEDTIRATPDSVAGRTSGSLVSDAARTRLVQNDLAPLQELYTTQGNALSDASADLGDLQSQVDSKATMAYGSDTDRANSLLKMYDAAFQNEQEMEKRRQFEAQLAESRAARKTAGVPNTEDDTKVGVVQQAAYSDVANRIAGSAASIRSDYNATLTSANYGNKLDQVKIQLYHQLRPDIFPGAVPSFNAGNNNKPVTFNGVTWNTSKPTTLNLQGGKLPGVSYL